MVRQNRGQGQAHENARRGTTAAKPTRRSVSGVRESIERLTLFSVPAGRAAVRSFHIALQAPAVDHFSVETPVGANPETRQLAASQQLVNRRRMYAKIFGQLFDRHHAR